MLFLVFQLGGSRYAIDARHVVEVLPFVEARRIPHAPAGIAGLFDYRAEPVPLIDLSRIILGRPSMPRLSTRIILCRLPDEGGAPRLLGLLAEKATEILRRDLADFVSTGVVCEEAPYLSAVCAAPEGFIHRLDADVLLSSHLRETLLKWPEVVQ